MKLINFVKKDTPYDKSITMTLREIVAESFETQSDLRNSGIYVQADWHKVEKMSGVFKFIRLALTYMKTTQINNSEKREVAES